MGTIKNGMQINLFDILEHSNSVSLEIEKDTTSIDSINDCDKNRFDNYCLDYYCKDVNEFGLKNVWDKINFYVLNYESNNAFLNTTNFGELYEIGLALIDKQQKKNSGQYYTPEDVAYIMSSWFNELNAENICDVACGTGKLILTYLDILGRENAVKLISDGKLYLYDLDGVALSICKTIILKKYGKELASKIHDVHCDFLDKRITLPENCKVISNPPYAAVSKILPNWNGTDVSYNTKELYSMFMEKIITQSKASVIITPYSFIGGNKFYSLRLLMNEYNGFIVSFDNVPGNIFCGRKHGIFNTNTSNSVRAAITVVKNNNNQKGFRLTPLIRFKNEERKKLLVCEVLEEFLSNKYQLVDKNNTSFSKCHKELQDIYETWMQKSDKTVKDILVANKNKFSIYMPNTCRYFTTASSKELKRTGMMTLFAKDESMFNFLYCLINSSFAYWWWRIFDGGITYPIGLLNKLPIFDNLLTEDDKSFFANIVSQMVNIEKDCIVTKLNAGTVQENIKFPSEYRNKINQRLLKILGFTNINFSIFDVVHKNSVFGGIEEHD